MCPKNFSQKIGQKNRSKNQSKITFGSKQNVDYKMFCPKIFCWKYWVQLNLVLNRFGSKKNLRQTKNLVYKIFKTVGSKIFLVHKSLDNISLAQMLPGQI